jgi:fibronectin type 3 domain-containing protein
MFTDRQPGLTNYYALSVFDVETEKFSSNSNLYAELIDSIPPSLPSGLAGKIDTTGIVRLAWNKNKDKDIDGYRVYRSNRPDFEFMLISPSVITDTLFTDSVNLNTLTKQVYYRLRAIDLRQNQSEFSAILELKRPDIIPPVSPRIQNIEEQKNGLLITWLNSSSEDVVRHHIYRKESNDSVFQLLTALEKRPGTQSTYQDKSVQAGETYIYQIKAEDDSGLYSVPSSPVQKKAPGEIAEQIVLKKQEYLGEVRLTWTVKSKKKVARILIYKALDDASLQSYDSSTENSYTDKELATEKTFRYRIKALYEDGSSSGLSNEIVVKM